jgi:WD40 repeat protein
MANDSQRFVKTFREPISQSALHVYASAIPFTPGDTLLYSTYGNKHDIRVLEGIRSQWTACLHVLEPTDYRGAGVMQNYEGLDPVHTATISTDGRRILSQSNTGILRLWDAATGFLMEEASEISISRSFKPSSPSHPTALFSPNGKRIISFCYVLRLWNGLDLRAIGGPFRGHKGITTAATYSADGSCIASGSADTTVRLWNGNDGSACGNTLRGHSGSINTVAFSPDGETLVSASADCTIRLWSISRGRPIGEPLTGHSGKGTRALISPNGLRIISTSGDGAVRFWDMTGNLIAQRNADTIPPPPGRVLPMAFSSEGSRVVVGLDRELQVLDTMVGALIGNPIKGHTAPVKILAFSRDGRYIVSSTGSSTIRVWESTTGAPVGVDLRGHIDSVTSVEFAPNGRHIISASDDETVRLWDVTLVDPAVEPKFVGRPMNISVKPEPRDDSLITISADGKCLAYYWSGRLHLAMGGRHVERRVNLHKQLTLSPNGQFLVATEEPRYEEGGCATYLYTLKDKPAGDFLNARVEVPTDSKNILSISFSSDGKRMLVVLPSSLETWGGGLESIEYTLLGKVVAQTETYVLASISPDGRRVVSTSSTRTIQLWDSTTFTPIGQSLLGHGDDIQSIRFSEDGSLIVSQSESQMLCWEVNSQLPVKIPSSSINVGFSKLDWRTGWVETLDGRKLWWMPASNRGWASVMSPQAHLATIGATGELTLVDGTRLGQQAKRGWAN